MEKEEALASGAVKSDNEESGRDDGWLHGACSAPGLGRSAWSALSHRTLAVLEVRILTFSTSHRAH